MSSLPLAGCRVLVVEDEYLLAEDLRRTLIESGADVVGPLADLDAAMKQVQRDGFEVAVLDLNLRDEMAYPVADALKQHNIPFVFATGYDRGTIPQRFADIVRWEKPFSHIDLVADICRLCPKN